MSKLRKILIILINALMLALLAVCVIRFYLLSHMHNSQLAAERWSGDSGERFTQVSCFMPETSAMSRNSIPSIRDAVDKKLIENSFETPENSRAFIDAYCGMGQITVSSQRASAQVEAIGVGGDFFSFHPMRLRSGSYISESDLMQDRVVIDEELAWKLFGAYDVAGMEVSIGGIPYLVAGVVMRDKDFATEKAYSADAGLYVSFEILEALTGSGISIYEIVLPNPITGIGHKIVTEVFPNTDLDIIENTSRFGVERLFELVTDFGARSMHFTAVKYPFWENAARLTEDHLALLLVIICLLAIIPAISLISIIIMLFRKLRSKRKDIISAIGGLFNRAIDVYRRRRFERNRDKAPKKRKLPPQMTRKIDAGAVKPLPAATSEKADEETQFGIETIISEVMSEQKDD